VEKFEAVPLLRFATQKAERPSGEPAAHTLEGAAPLQTSQQKERLCEANRRASLAFSGRALAPLPHPPRTSTKTRTLLWMVGLVWPLSLKLELCWIEQKGPKDESMSFQVGPGLVQYVQVSVLPSAHGL